MSDRQTAIEAAPTLIYPDGDGGVTYHILTDDELLAAATSIADENNWNDEERNGLYQAMTNLLAAIGEKPE